MRNNIQDFSLANPIYKGATVTFYTVSGGVKTTTKATLYADLTSATVLGNPQQLDAEGRFQQPVYVEEPIIASISGLTIPNHDTGIIDVDVAPCVVSALPSATTKGITAKGFVTDANATAFASVVVGGGTNKVPVYSDGANWRIG